MRIFSRRISLVSVVMLIATLIGVAQTQRVPRKSSPVDSDDEKPRTVMHYYDKHGNPLQEPIRFLAVLDTVTVPKSKPIYPLYNGISVSVSGGDMVSLISSKPWLDLSVAADVSIYNWIFPTLELGMVKSLHSLSASEYSYAAPYCKLGVDYNFLYKSNPDYRLALGLRGAYSPLSKNAGGVTHCYYGDLVGGIKVKIASGFSMGWNLRYHFNIKTLNAANSLPAYIPGMGGDSALPVTLSVAAYYTFGPKAKSRAELILPAH